jgi:hypothetical protein
MDWIGLYIIVVVIAIWVKFSGVYKRYEYMKNIEILDKCISDNVTYLAVVRVKSEDGVAYVEELDWVYDRVRNELEWVVEFDQKFLSDTNYYRNMIRKKICVERYRQNSKIQEV